jgi:hypothetical protein
MNRADPTAENGGMTQIVPKSFLVGLITLAAIVSAHTGA